MDAKRGGGASDSAAADDDADGGGGDARGDALSSVRSAAAAFVGDCQFLSSAVELWATVADGTDSQTAPTLLLPHFSNCQFASDVTHSVTSFFVCCDRRWQQQY